MKETHSKRRRGAAALAAAVLAVLLFAAACSNGSTGNAVDYSGCLFMSDTKNGNVYTYNPASKAASATTIAASSPNAGEIAFYRGIGYVCVGSGSGEGLYFFDPSAINPSFSRIGTSIAAQYAAFYGATKAYVSAYDYSGTTSGLYSFDPSKPGSGLASIPAVSGKYLQDLVIAADGYLYAADNGNQAVLKINPGTDSVSATYAATKTGTTGLLAGTYKGAAGVFAANTGGSIDFIPSSGGSLVSVIATTTSDPIYPGRLVQLPNGDLVATGYDTGWFNHTYLVALSGATPIVKEVKTAGLAGGSSFGSLDIAYKDGLVYVPDYYSASASKLYIFDESGAMQSGSPLAVMGSGDSITNVGFYED